MGRYLFRLPDIGEGVAEAEVVVWHVKVGDKVEEDQSLVDVMTDKATVDMTSPVRGTVTALHGEVGQLMPVGSVLVELDVDGAGNLADPPATVVAPNATPEKKQPTKAAPATTIVRKSERPRESTPVPVLAARNGDIPLAAPATRARAYELGIPLQFVPGTGPGGRITPEDLDAYVTGGSDRTFESASARKRRGVTEQKIIGLRRKIAEKMQDSKRRIPHFSYVEEFDLTELEALRKDLNDERSQDQPKLTLLPFLMRAVVLLQKEFPNVNALYDDEGGVLQIYDGVHIGIATQTSGGLMVPVVRHAEALDIWGCARELARVTAAARDGSATREELSGSTITLTSLGAIGGLAATPIINSPEVAIIGPNKLDQRVVVRHGQMVIRTMMNVSSSFDHRIIDGHAAASFIQRMKRLVERPTLLFVERP